MLDDQLRNEPFPDTWDNTMRLMFRNCPRRFYFFMRGYDYGNKPAFFSWGSAWHEVLAYWYSTEHSWEPQAPGYWKAAQASLDAGYGVWDQDSPEEDNVNKREKLETIFLAYLEHFPAEPWKMIEKGSEVGWEYPIKGTPYYLGGSNDGRIEWPEYGVIPLEHKTTSTYLTDAFVNQFYFSTQVEGYIWHEYQLSGNLYCLVNMATKQIPGPRSKWTTPRFHRIPIKKTIFELEAYVESFLFDIKLARQCWDRWYWPKGCEPINCSGGIGKVPCLFKHFCMAKAGKKGFEKFDLSKYPGIKMRDGKWEPWKRQGEQL